MSILLRISFCALTTIALLFLFSQNEYGNLILSIFLKNFPFTILSIPFSGHFLGIFGVSSSIYTKINFILATLLILSLFFIRSKKISASYFKKSTTFIPIGVLDSKIKVEISIQKSIKSFIKDLLSMLEAFNIPCKVLACTPSKSITVVNLKTNFNEHAMRVGKLSVEIAKCMCADTVRIVAQKNLVKLEIANKLRPKLQMIEVVSSPLFNRNPTIPLGLNVLGKISMLNLDKLRNLTLIGDSYENKKNLIHSWLVSMIFQGMPVEVFIFSPSNKYEIYKNINKINVNQYKSTYKDNGIFIIDSLDEIGNIENLKYLLNNKARVIAVVNDLNKCLNIVREYFHQKVIFKMTDGRRHVINKQYGAEWLLDDDILYVDERDVHRFQTVTITEGEIFRVAQAVRMGQI